MAPRYYATNFEAIIVETDRSLRNNSGVLIKEDGTVQAVWLSYLGDDKVYHYGLATSNFHPILNEIRDDKIPKLRVLNVEFGTLTMNQAHHMGVSEAWIEKVEAADPERHQLLKVERVSSYHDCGLNEGDVLLTLGKKLVKSSYDLDVMYKNDFLDAVVVRKGEEKAIRVSTVPTDDFETDHLVIFCGGTFQRPHQAVH
ncbi:Pro-apoptotic serine protease [Pyrenophora seminiperda CCB06]|uniref:Pro-apoptotic serine protease n=1 Tax=Pyrenophora seminiperda CCB06 TaxID=1302712 RepID=A0A3M7MA72_9PLEO|nr:Pro-apoptotic serine protease [Pyrenophora seminiperda CCB06]